MSCFDLGHNGVLEPPDFCLKGITAVEENHLFASRCNELVDLGGREVRPAIDDTGLVNVKVLRRAEGNQLISHADRKTGKISTGAFGPLEVDVLKARPLLGSADVLLHRAEWSTNSSVDAVLRDNDSSLKAKTVTERPLPEANGLRVGEWREAVVQENFVWLHSPMLRKFPQSEKV